jgi:polysaccharide pyruvyl transferase WcaK-like protein
MQIGLIGWYGQGNAGDERILYCIRRFFQDHDLFVTTAWQDALDKVEDLNRCEFVLVGGGGLILRGVDHWTKLLMSLDPPMGCIGISVETEHSDAAQFIEILKTRSEFILVRDKQSTKFFQDHPNVIVAPDLTFLYPYEPVQLSENCVLGLNLRPWHYWRGELYGVRYVRMAMLNHYLPFLERIYPFEKWCPDKLVTQLQQLFTQLLPIPLCSSSDGTNDVSLLKEYFPNVSEGFVPADMAACRYLIGMRLHSLIFACQMGVPFISLSYMPKNHRFCESVGLASFSLQLYDLSELSQAVSQLKASTYVVREQLLQVSRENRASIERAMHDIMAVMGI